jgi:hypothetical protein
MPHWKKRVSIPPSPSELGRTFRWPYRPAQFLDLISIASKLRPWLKSKGIPLGLAPSAPNSEGSMGSQPLCSLLIAFYRIPICQRMPLPLFIGIVVAHLQLFGSAQTLQPESFIPIDVRRYFLDYLRFGLSAIGYL